MPTGWTTVIHVSVAELAYRRNCEQVDGESFEGQSRKVLVSSGWMSLVLLWEHCQMC